MNCNSFYAKSKPGKLRINVNQGVYHQEINNYIDLPDDNASDISEFLDKDDDFSSFQLPVSFPKSCVYFQTF